MSNIAFTILACLLALIPFIFSPGSSELFEFPKLLLIYFGASLLFPLVLYRIREKRLYKNLSFNAIAVTLAIFIGSQALSSFFSLDTHVSLFGYYSRFNGGLLSLLSYSVIFLAGYIFLTREKALKLVKLAFVVGLGVALWGLPSHFGYDLICLVVKGAFNTSCWTNDFIPELRIFATLGQPNWFATYLLILIGINLFLFTTGQRILNSISGRLSSFMLISSFLLFSVELIWTNSKSGILTYIVLVPTYFLAQFVLNRTRIRSTLKSTYYLVLLTFMIVFLSQALPIARNLLKSFTNSGSATISQISPSQKPNPDAEYHITPSSDIRLIVWKGAFELGQRHPLIGTGVETFAYGYYLTRPIKHNLTSEWNFVYNKAHNELLNYFATSGYLGLVSYLLFYSALMLPALLLLFQKSDKSELSYEKLQLSMAYLFALASIFSMNFFGFSTTVTSLFTYLLPALYLAYLYNESETAATKEQRILRTVTINQLALYFVWVLFSFVYLLNYFSADFSYARGREYKQISDFNNAYLQTQKAIDLRREPTYLDQQAAVSANLAALSQIQKQNPQVKQLTKLAKEYSEESLKISPKNVFYYKTRAKLYYLLALTNMHEPEVAADYSQKAVHSLETARSLAPTDPIIPYTLATLLVDQDPVRSTELVEQSLELKPDYAEAKDLLNQLQKE